MPTSKIFQKPPQTSVTELKLELPKSRSVESKKSIRSIRKVKPTYEVCGGIQSESIIPSVREKPKRGRETEISVYDVVLPSELEEKAIIRVPDERLKVVPDDESSKSTPRRKVRGYDLTSSTNSHFEGWLLAVPKKFKRPCSGTSSSESQSDSRASSSLKSSPATKNLEEKVVTSQEMIDSQHEGKPQKLNLRGPEWQKPCKGSFVAGAPRPYIGTCPPNFEEIAKMARARQKFFLTMDPRKKYCLTNPQVLRRKAFSKKKEFNVLTKMVKHADNVCAATDSNTSESFICEEIDLENPLQLDFQGMDYKNTYECDEQDMQNQRLYRRICRYMERRRVKAETEEMVEKELQHERVAIPKCFAVTDRNIEEESSEIEEPTRFGKLFRAADKPFNKERIALEQNERRARYKDLYLRRKAKADKEKEVQEQMTKDEDEQKAGMLAMKHLWNVLGGINAAIARSFKMERQLRRQEIQRRIFPHTMRETMLFKKKLKAQNRIKRDEAKVKREFYQERLGVLKDYPEADLEISSDTPKHSETTTLTEQSSDDEDAMEVGKEGNIIKLRGFHFKLGEHLRGKRHQHERKEKGCMTREQWLAMLAPKKETIKVDIEEGIQKFKSPDDPELVLFHPQYGFKAPKPHDSAVHQYIQKRLGRHYERALRKNLKLVRPRLKYNIKKFNLIRFLYDDKANRNLQRSKPRQSQKKDIDLKNLDTTVEYMQAKEEIRKQQHHQIKQKRLELLGIPCKIVKKSRLQTLCEQSDSGTDPEWVPEAEPDLVDQEEENAKLAMAKSIRVSLRQRGNMPAPQYRETTLRRHPRRPRNYFGERVQSLLLDEAVAKTGIPHMFRMPPDDFEYSDLNIRKRPYSQMFEARRHHDHWNPTQLKVVDVHYQANIVQPTITKVKGKADRVLMENFRMANPPCNAFVEMDLTMPKWDTKGMIEEYLKSSKHKVDDTDKDRTKDICHPRDFIFHSRSRTDFQNLDYPGRQEYLQFLHEVRQALYEKKVEDDGKEKLVVDKDELIKDLETDLKSIESCLTSLSSSECTNLTNDSGSFLLMEGKTKIPLDYIRKSVVPFEELQRSRFEVKPIDVDTEDANPFKVLPFSGQRKAQLELTTAKDSFFTFNSRLKNGLRLRLEVPVEDVRQKLLGRGSKKYPGAVTTDIDENYVDELKNRPPIRSYNFKSGRSFIKDALRLKFESMLIQGQIVRTKIYDRLNEQHWENMQRTKVLYEKLFTKWEKREYEGAMSVVHKVKSYYDVTDTLKREFRELERQQLVLNMDIVFIEGHWIRCIMLQNFHYLLGDQEWRYENDWIHRLPPRLKQKPSKSESEESDIWEEESDEYEDVELENFEESIAKRNIVNIRVRDKDDAWAIKAFYENVYLKNLHPILIVFPDADSFLKGIDNLKIKTFVLLLELHFTLSIHTELQGRLETFEEWCLQDLKEKEEYVSRKCAKKYFMTDRAQELRRRTLDFIERPVEESFNDEAFLKDRAVIAEVWRHIVPDNMRGSSDQDLEPIQMVAMMSEVVVELIAKFEAIPMEQSRRVESRMRRQRAYQRKLSQQAYQVEKRIESEMKKVRRNLEPPYQKPKRVGKLPRIYIKKKEVKEVVQERRISEHTRFFFRAFHDEGDVMQLSDARDSLFVMDTIQEQIVPFYFDHFLKLNGYTPNYNFKTNVEMRDGPESERILVRSVLPDVMDKLEKWELIRKRTMEENISRNPKMYENVNF